MIRPSKDLLMPLVTAGSLLAACLLAGCFESVPDPGDEQEPVTSWSQTLASAELSYVLAQPATPQTDRLEVKVPGERNFTSTGTVYSQPSVRKAAALSNMILGMKSATEAYFGDLIAHCEQQAADLVVECPDNLTDWYGETLTCEEFEQQQREYERLVCLGNEQEGQPGPDIEAGAVEGHRVVNFIDAEARALDNDAGLLDERALVEQLVLNMLAGGAPPPYRDWGMGDPRNGGYPSAEMDASDGIGGELGATPGGAQDIGFIRKVIDEGYVPFPFHMAVEGLLSEHDLPLQGAPCDQLLCIKTGVGVARTLDHGTQSAFVQLGFSSGFTTETFQRADLNLVVVLDKSGSMRDSGTENAAKMGAVKEGLQRMIDRLGPQDRLSVVLFNNEPRLLFDSVAVTDREALKAIVEGIEAGGGTNIEAGLRMGYQVAARHSEPGARLDRVMLMTDALPNVGRTGESSFLELVDHYAAQGMGLTVFGVGLNFGQELILEICDRRGGNYFFLEDAAKIHKVFTEDFDFIVTPLAYDLHLDFTAADGFKVADVFGIRDWENDPSGVSIDVKTVFLSRNRGAIVLRLETDDIGPM